MKILYCVLISIFLMLIYSVSLFAQVADSPWPMFHHDLKHTGYSPLNGPEDPVLYWKFETDGDIASSPSI